MKFKSQPNLFVKISNKYTQRVTGLKGFYFDENGVYETKNELLIKVLSQNFETVIEDLSEPTEEQIRALAKEKGIKNWHNKKIANIITELKEV